MSEETATDVPASSTHTTVIREDGSGGAGWVIAIVLLIAVIAGIYFYSRASSSQSAKDNAIAGAAKDIGGAAKKAGDAVDEK